MKKTVLLVLIFTLLIALVSCYADTENKGIDTSESSFFDDVETEKLSEKDRRREEINGKLTALYTQNNEDIFLLQDDQVYKYGSVDSADGIRFVSEIPYDSGKEVSYIMEYDLLVSGEREYICTIENCKHDDIWCMAANPAKAGRQYFPLRGEDGEFEVVYTVGLMYKSLEVDGITWSNKDYYTYDMPNVIYEINLKTGTKKAIAIGFPIPYEMCYYYNGYMFCTVMDYVKAGEGEYLVLVKPITINTQTGEWKLFDTETYANIVGVIEGFAYILDGDGNLYKSDLSFDNVELVKTIDYKGDDSNTVLAEIIGDKLYYRSNYDTHIYTYKDKYGAEESSGQWTTDLFVTSIYDIECKGKLIAEDVISMWGSYEQNKLYFNTWEYKHYGIYTTTEGFLNAYTFCNGTLRYVDAVTGEVSTVFENCGSEVGTVHMVTDDMIVFSGVNYAGVDEGYEYDRISSTYNKYDINAGVVTLLYTWESY